MSVLLTKTLGVICPSCDFLNVVGAVRCMACSAATDGSVAQAPAAPKAGAFAPAPRAAAVEEPVLDASLAPPQAAPPGLAKKTGPQPVYSGPAPTGSQKAVGGPPARPTFQSSAAPPAATAAGPRFGLTVLAGPARGQRFKLAASGAQIGRSRGAILFPEDPFVSALHASLAVRDGKLFIRDEASTSGIYVSINGQETIPAGGTFCTGLRLFRYVGPVEPVASTKSSEVQTYGAPLPNGAEHFVIEEVLLGDRPARALMTAGPTITIGQSSCDFTFPSDEGLAKRHCEVAPMPSGAMVRDLSGGLGTYVRCQGERAIRPGDRLRIGQQTLQVEELK